MRVKEIIEMLEYRISSRKTDYTTCKEDAIQKETEIKVIQDILDEIKKK